MSHYIEGTVNADRKLEFTPAPVYSGEQNNNILKIDITGWTGIDPDYYLISCETSPIGEVFITAPITDSSEDIYVDEGYIYCPLTYMMTRTGRLKIQITACKSDDQGREIFEKTSVASPEIGPSLSPGRELVTYDSAVWTRLNRLESTLAGLCDIYGFSREFSFDYFSVAIAARLLFVNEEQTPVFFPSSAEEAESIINDAIDNTGEWAYLLVVVPSVGRSRAELCVVTAEDGVADVALYSGRDLLDFLRRGFKTNE